MNIHSQNHPHQSPCRGTSQRGYTLQSRQGFALIATISIMVLLVMIALAMLSLSTIESRDSNRSNDRAIAQQNARMALMIAIGQLQESLGPDQRVSATASIFDTDPTTLEIDGVNLPHTLGAWSTLTNNGNPIIYQTDDGYHMDRRSLGDASFEDHRRNVKTWLISGGDQANFFDFDSATFNLTGRTLVTLGHENKGNDKVEAPVVPVRSGGTSITGGYAYHVTDLGMAAPIIDHNPTVTENPDNSDTTNGGYANLYTGRKRPYDKLADTNEALADFSADTFVSDLDQSSKYPTYKTLEINPNGTENEEAKKLLKENDQSYTLTNSSLFTNTIDGGFKTDLSSFIQDTADPGNGELLSSTGATILSDTTPLLSATRFAALSPKFGALRDYIRLGDLMNSDREMDPRAPIAGGGNNDAYADPTKVIKHGIHPVLAEFSLYNDYVYDPASPSNLSALVYPRITLWNPYNVTLNATDYYVQIHYGIRAQPHFFQDGNAETYGFTNHNTSTLASDPTGANKLDPVFYLPGVRLEPGQALVFIPSHSGAQPMQPRDGAITLNRLTADKQLSAMSPSAFSVNCSIPRYLNGVAFDLSKGSTYDPSGGNNANDFQVIAPLVASLRLGKGGSSFAGLNATTGGEMNAPIIHTMDATDHYRNNNIKRYRRVDQGPFDLQNINTPSSWTDPGKNSRLGLRFKMHPDESGGNGTNHPDGFWDYPFLELSNLRSPFYRRTIYDWPTEFDLFGDSSFGPMTCEDGPPRDYYVSLPETKFIGGLSETSPFFNPLMSGNNLRTILFDVPSPGIQAFSMGQLRQATLTHEFGAPTFIIGESLVPITAPRDQSAHPITDYTGDFNTAFYGDPTTGFTVKNDPTSDSAPLNRRTPWWQIEYDPSEGYACYDYRFEVNHALWDQYFFSTLPKSGKLEDFLTNKNLPNNRIKVVNTDSTIDLSDATAAAPDLIAKSLRISNHLSVNSTHMIAWQSLLSMNLGMSINDKTTSANAAPFPGTTTPEADGGEIFASGDPFTWQGYRELNSTEVETLAANIIEQVKRRAPFISLSDFVNRRLHTATIAPSDAPNISNQSDDDLLSYAGPTEIAIYKAGINQSLQDRADQSAANYATSRGVADIPTSNMPTESYANAPAHLTQGKVLEVIGSSLTSRSDTFRIRAYGESKNAQGEITATAWCEAIVQRNPQYIDPSADSPEIKPTTLTSTSNKQFGRKFTIQSFRWLSANEI